MPVLREAKSWRRPRASRGPDLTTDEVQRVRAAIAFLKAQRGSLTKLAQAMGLKTATLVYAASSRGGVSAGVALRTARAAGVPVETILSGAWPPPGACPHCGRV